MDTLNKKMLADALSTVREVKASALLLYIDAADDWGFWKNLPASSKKKVVLLTQRPETEKELSQLKKELKAVLKLPEVKLTRIGQIKLSTIMCITEGIIKSDDRIVCLTGSPARGVLDMLMTLDLSKETEVFTTMNISKDLDRIKPEVLEVVLNLALALASEGREGRAIGTTFVIGDNEKVGKLSRPLIMNPFKGYPEESRNILDEAVHETIKEFSLLDGAFIVREDGVVMAAGAHLDAALNENGHTLGLGSRHMAAAGITDVTDAVAVTISGSTGIVRIFRKGKILFEIERPARMEEGGKEKEG